jgi:hypothetical protein
VGHVKHLEMLRNSYTVLFQMSKGYKDLFRSGRLMLKLILNKYGLMIKTLLI